MKKDIIHRKKSKKVLVVAIIMIITLIFIFLPSYLKKEVDSDKTISCQKEGGKLVAGLGEPICSFPTTDADKPCNSSSECEGACIGVESGRCSGWTNTLGCLPRYEQGNYQGMVCAD